VYAPPSALGPHATTRRIVFVFQGRTRWKLLCMTKSITQSRQLEVIVLGHVDHALAAAYMETLAAILGLSVIPTRSRDPAILELDLKH
jgi:hypothetical protein